jgi:hypothetical protein
MDIQKLPLRLQKCIDRNGDYVEKWVHVQDSTDVSKIENKCLFYIFKERRPYVWNQPRITFVLPNNWSNRIFESRLKKELYNGLGIFHWTVWKFSPSWKAAWPSATRQLPNNKSIKESRI